MGRMSGGAAPARELQLTDIRPHASSYVDPQGFVFEFERQVYRCIQPDAAPLFRQLLADGLLARLTAECGLVQTQEAGLTLADEPEGLVLRHARVEPVTYCVEWCHSMLWEAARLTLDLARDLTARDLMLQDAYPWNVLFRGCEPVFVDVSSIAPKDTGVLWPAAEQFEAFFLRSLVLSAEGKGAGRPGAFVRQHLWRGPRRLLPSCLSRLPAQASGSRTNPYRRPATTA